MKKLRDHNIQNKLLIYFFALILVPFTSLNIIQFKMNTNGLTETLSKNTKQMLRQIDMNIESSLGNLIKTARVIENNSAVKSFFGKQEQANTEYLCRNLLANILDQHQEISGILLLRSDDQYISNEMYKISKDSLIQEKWYTDAIAKDSPHIISRPIARNISTTNKYDSDEILSIVVPIKEGDFIFGVIVIDYYLSDIEELIKTTIVGLEGFTYIIDDSGNVIFTPINNVTYRINSKKLIKHHEEDIAIDIKGQAYQIIKKPSSINNWTIIGVFPINDLYSHVRRFNIIQLLILIMIMILTFIFTYVINKSITSPIRDLQEVMKKTENGNLNISYNVDRKDEIGELGISFNQMISKIRSLLMLIEEEQAKKIEAELKVLQAQIKPHFLYNTLDTIRWMAVEEQAFDIETVVQSLTSLFRIGLNKGQDTIALSEEIEHVKSYLMIQKFRYEDELQFTIDNQHRNLTVLKIILQPLVENAIYHGIKEKDGIGHIRIKTSLEDQLVITVTDDGIGLPEKKINDLNKALILDNSQDLGYGIFNVNSRLKLAYGPTYGIKLENNKPGIKVTINHPIIRQGDVS